MGILTSRLSRAMSDTDNRSHSPENPMDDDSMQALLTYLVRSGHVRLITSDDTDDMDDGDDDDDDEDEATKTFRRSTLTTLLDSVETATASKPDTSKIDNNDIKLLTEQASGNTLRYNVTDYLLNRDQRTNPLLSGQEKCSVNNKFLPNHMKKECIYQNKVFCGQYNKYGDIFMSACQDQKIRVYNTASDDSFTPVKEIEARDVGWSIIDIALSPDGCHVIYSSWSDYIHQCNIFGDQDNHLAFKLEPQCDRFCVFSLRFSYDGSEIIGGASDNCLYVYSRDIEKRILKINAHADDVNTVCFADSSSQIVFSGSDDGLCKVWDRRLLTESNPKPVGVFAGHSSGITHIDSKGDARYVISNSKDQTIKLWDVRAFSSQGDVKHCSDVLDQSARYHWDYRWQPVPRKRRSIKSDYDASIMTYTGHRVQHTLMRSYFSPAQTTGQRFIYTGCASGDIFIYDVITGEVESRLQSKHKACVRDVAWHPYLNEMCSSSWDGTVGRWSHNSKKRLENDSDLPEEGGRRKTTHREKHLASHSFQIRQNVRRLRNRMAGVSCPNSNRRRSTKYASPLKHEDEVTVL